MALGVYLHLPFCLSRCRYCAFYSGEPLSRRAELVEQLATELFLRTGEAVGPLGSVYFGGGTPSLLRPDQLHRLLMAVRAAWGDAGDLEVTLELNPGDRLPLAELRTAGFNRLSVGVQSLDDALLAALGRRHSADQARGTISAAATAGFSSVSADLLIGLPQTHPDTLARWVFELVSAGATHLSLYSLELHPGSELAIACAEGRFRPASDDLEDTQFHSVIRAAQACGMEAYEVSNAAVAGHRCRHNLNYWQGGPYLGLGPGAHSFLPDSGPWGTRSWNIPQLSPYLTALKQGLLPPVESEVLTREQALLERLFLQLRCSSTFSPATLAVDFDLHQKNTLRAFSALTEQGFFSALPAGALCPTWAAMRRADALAIELHSKLLAGEPVA